MALAGDEKRIRALFSELSLEDQAHAPYFETLWRRAENIGTAKPARVRRFNTSASVIVSIAMAFIAAVLGAWFWPSNPLDSRTQTAVNVGPKQPAPVSTPATRESNNPTPPTNHARSHPRRKTNILTHRTTQPSTTEAQMLSSWQSPTNILMASPASVVFDSLPQLNESAEELKQFLPKPNEANKESNQ